MSLTIQQPSVVHSTFVIQRSYAAAPARVFAAFADPAKKRRWFLETGGHQVEEFHLDLRPGGREQARFRFKEGTPLAGQECETQGTYPDVVPDRRIVFSSTMSIAGKCISASLLTVELLPEDAGTTLILTHQGAFFEGSDGPEMREKGWRTLLERAAAEL